MPSLRERYFLDPLKVEEDEKEKIQERWAAQARFIHDEYLKAEFLPWLETALEQYEPKPGSHESMLHSTGVRAGLKLVKDHIDRVRRNVEELEKNA